MVKLKAKYGINLKNGMLLINRPTADDLSFEVKIDDFDVELCLIQDKSIWPEAAVVAGEEYWSTSAIRIIVERNEEIAPPIIKFVNGHRSLDGSRSYYDERSSDYQNAALEAINRAILFFKYKLHNPNLFVLSSRDVKNPAWSVEGGLEFSPTFIAYCPLYNHDPGFDIKHLSSQYDSDLTDALQNCIHPELSEELMSDAQSAVLQGNLKRAVLEMAMACEITVKQAFFAKATPARAACKYLENKSGVPVPIHKIPIDNDKLTEFWQSEYERLENKSNVHVSIPELIDSVAKQAFGKSFKEEEVSHYKNIDFLFRGRNKVAHRGELIYKDNSEEHHIDNDKLAEWWKSVTKLRSWLLTRAKEQEATKPT